MFASGNPGADLLEVNLLPRPVHFNRVEIVDARGRALLRRSEAPTNVAVPLIALALPIKIGVIVATNGVQVGAEPAKSEVDRILLTTTNVRVAIRARDP